MTFPPRRVVTGHDADGRSIIVNDSIADNGISRRAGHRSFVLWATERVPAEIQGDDGAIQTMRNRSLPQGTVFRIVEYGPGVTPARHRTDSIDYAVVLSGEIDLILHDEVVRLTAGDTLIQRGTEHDWANNGVLPCVIAFCLVGASQGSQSIPVPSSALVADADGDANVAD